MISVRREHPWIRIETDKRKSQKFGQDLCHVVKYMKKHDIEAMQEIMKQAPDFNTRDREQNKTALQIALDKSKTLPSFSFVARYLALQQLMHGEQLEVRESGLCTLCALFGGVPREREIVSL